MKISFIGKFKKLHDEEYIARSFEKIGCEVQRIEQGNQFQDINSALLRFQPDIVLYCKWEKHPETQKVIRQLGAKTVCWLFDIYFDYVRERQVATRSFFRSDYVFTTDGGHNKRFANAGIKHFCVRQGIYDEECALFPIEESEYDVIFVGSDNSMFPERTKIINEISKDFKVRWFGKLNTNELRGMQLNQVFAKAKIVIGDSYYSPQYWSNRVVETLGRGGFLIHQEVEGLNEEYPDLVTYKRGDIKDLKEKIQYYLEHEGERREIIKKNYNLVKSRYTMDKKCRDLLDYVETY